MAFWGGTQVNASIQRFDWCCGRKGHAIAPFLLTLHQFFLSCKSLQQQLLTQFQALA
jgi:hypothetical protein